MHYKSYTPDDLTSVDRHQLIIGAVSPRPIALVSTQDGNGIDNLAPYSFFNAISSSPPILIFSVSKPQPGQKECKDTLTNIRETKECVINIIDYKMARQMSLCSVGFDHSVSEFEKSGFKRLDSEFVKAKRVKGSPVQFECTVRDILVFGSNPGAANLVICDVVKIHVDESVHMKDKLRIDNRALESVGRMGRSYYAHIQKENVFEIYQPVQPVCIGFDALPKTVFETSLFNGWELAELASNTKMPSRDQLDLLAKSLNEDSGSTKERLLIIAKSLLEKGDKEQALQYVCAAEAIK